MMTGGDFLKFEADFIGSLRCIPMIVRMKLDTSGIKLKLDHWQKFSHQEKQDLVKISCSKPHEIEEFKVFVQNLVTSKTGERAKTFSIDPQPAWLDKEQIPLSLKNKLGEFNQKISLKSWSKLSNLQRFALIKLSRPSHENRNFLPALEEFNLLN